MGQIEGLLRLLDVGQCNDSYSAIQIALALAKAFDTDVNSLPLSDRLLVRTEGASHHDILSHATTLKCKLGS